MERKNQNFKLMNKMTILGDKMNQKNDFLSLPVVLAMTFWQFLNCMESIKNFNFFAPL